MARAHAGPGGGRSLLASALAALLAGCGGDAHPPGAAAPGPLPAFTGRWTLDPAASAPHVEDAVREALAHAGAEASEEEVRAQTDAEMARIRASTADLEIQGTGRWRVVMADTGARGSPVEAAGVWEEEAEGLRLVRLREGDRDLAVPEVSRAEVRGGRLLVRNARGTTALVFRRR
jgi:hypothetical protein